MQETYETQVQPLGWEDPLEKGMANHSSFLAMDRGAWWATVHGVTNSWIRLEELSTHVFGLGPYSWHRALKTIGISCNESDKDVFCYIHEAILEST